MPAKKTAKKAAKTAPAAHAEAQPGVDPIDPPAAAPSMKGEFINNLLQQISDSIPPISVFNYQPEPQELHGPLDLDIDPPPIPPAKGRGVLRSVKNLHRSFGPEAHYVASTLFDEAGNEFPVLLTQTELEIITARARGMEAEIAFAPPLL